MTFDEWFARTFPAGYSPDGVADVLPMRHYIQKAWDFHTRALEQILYSVQQAQQPGNDVRRELKLIENTVKDAIK